MSICDFLLGNRKPPELDVPEWMDPEYGVDQVKAALQLLAATEGNPDAARSQIKVFVESTSEHLAYRVSPFELRDLGIGQSTGDLFGKDLCLPVLRRVNLREQQDLGMAWIYYADHGMSPDPDRENYQRLCGLAFTDLLGVIERRILPAPEFARIQQGFCDRYGLTEWLGDPQVYARLVRILHPDVDQNWEAIKRAMEDPQ